MMNQQDELDLLPVDDHLSATETEIRVMRRLFPRDLQQQRRYDQFPKLQLQQTLSEEAHRTLEWHQSWTRHLLLASLSTVAVTVIWQVSGGSRSSRGEPTWLDSWIARITPPALHGGVSGLGVPIRIACAVIILMGVQQLVDSHRIARIFIPLPSEQSVQPLDEGYDSQNGDEASANDEVDEVDEE